MFVTPDQGQRKSPHKNFTFRIFSLHISQQFSLHISFLFSHTTLSKVRVTQIELKEESSEANSFGIHWIHCICSIVTSISSFRPWVTHVIVFLTLCLSLEVGVQIAIQYFSLHPPALIKMVLFPGLYLSFPERKKHNFINIILSDAFQK